MDKVEKAIEEEKNEKIVNHEENIENQDEVLSWSDIIKINESLEREAEALLGGQNDNVCTYSEGYKFRQPLYSCKTCAAETGQRAGVCYACSFNCHDGHDLIELYTKRKFCCDCGNSKFKTKCKLLEKKNEINKFNKYDDNFDQIYCICKQIYPPLEGVSEANNEEMHQCCICEDWFHLTHIYADPSEENLLAKINANLDENWEMVCKNCTIKLPFLLYYAKLSSKNINNENNIDNLNVDVDNIKNKASNLNEKKDDKESKNFDFSIKTECLLKNFDFNAVMYHGIHFENPNWRNFLCRCQKCLNMYIEKECDFLLEPEDTMSFYDSERRRNMELKGEASFDTRLEKKSNMADSIYKIVEKTTNNRDAALNAYLGVQKMYQHMGEFFSKIGDGKVITKQDVERCFEELQAKKPRYDSVFSEEAAWTQ